METQVQAANQRATSSIQAVATCEICGHGYDQGVEVVAYGQSRIFHSFACAIQALAPRCAHCQRRIVGRGPAAAGATFCCDRCAKLPCSRPPGLFRDAASQTIN